MDKNSRLFAGLVTGVAAIVGAGIMWLGTIFVADMELQSRTLSLLSNREVAAHALQAEVFGVYAQSIEGILADGTDDHARVAFVSALHGNFSEFFETRPVLEAIATKLTDSTARQELTRLAKRTARRQATFIKSQVRHTDAMRTAVRMILKPRVPCTTWMAGHDVVLEMMQPTWRHYEKPTGTEYKTATLAFRDYDDDLIDDISDFATIKVKLTGDKAVVDSLMFKLSYMDTPFMDNFWMLHKDDKQYQMALRLLDIDTEQEEHSVRIEILHFPSGVGVFAATQRLPIDKLLDGMNIQ